MRDIALRFEAAKLDRQIKRLSVVDLVDLTPRQRKELDALRKQLAQMKEQQAELGRLMQKMTSELKRFKALSR